MRAGIEWPSVARADDEGWRKLQQQKTLPVAAHISERVGMAALLRLKRAQRALASEGNLRERCQGRGLPTGATSAASDWRRLAERVGFVPSHDGRRPSCGCLKSSLSGHRASVVSEMAERVGFGLRPVVENKGLTDFPLPPDPPEPLESRDGRTY